jgi:hypothetical protein
VDVRLAAIGADDAVKGEITFPMFDDAKLWPILLPPNLRRDNCKHRSRWNTNYTILADTIPIKFAGSLQFAAS